MFRSLSWCQREWSEELIYTTSTCALGVDMYLHTWYPGTSSLVPGSTLVQQVAVILLKLKI